MKNFCNVLLYDLLFSESTFWFNKSDRRMKTVNPRLIFSRLCVLLEYCCWNLCFFKVSFFACDLTWYPNVVVPWCHTFIAVDQWDIAECFRVFRAPSGYWFWPNDRESNLDLVENFDAFVMSEKRVKFSDVRDWYALERPYCVGLITEKALY